MSNEIKEKCETIKMVRERAHPCWIGPDDQPDCTYTVDESECGLSLEGLKRGDPQIEALFEAAKETGSVNILSQADIQQKANRFLKDAGTLITRLRKEKKSAQPSASKREQGVCRRIFGGCGFGW